MTQGVRVPSAKLAPAQRDSARMSARLAVVVPGLLLPGHHRPRR